MSFVPRSSTFTAQKHCFVDLAMSRMTEKIWRFITSEDGPTAVEYGIMLALIILAAIGAVLSTGDVQKALWTDNSATINSALSSN